MGDPDSLVEKQAVRVCRGETTVAEMERELHERHKFTESEKWRNWNNLRNPSGWFGVIHHLSESHLVSISLRTQEDDLEYWPYYDLRVRVRRPSPHWSPQDLKNGVGQPLPITRHLELPLTEASSYGADRIVKGPLSSGLSHQVPPGRFDVNLPRSPQSSLTVSRRKKNHH